MSTGLDTCTVSLFKQGHTTLDYPGSSLTEVLGINSGAVAVGYYHDSSSQQHGFLYAGGTFVQVDAPKGSFTQLTGVNDRSQLVGFYINDGLGVGVERIGDSFQTLSVPGTNGTFLHEIDTGEQLLGTTGTLKKINLGSLLVLLERQNRLVGLDGGES